MPEQSQQPPQWIGTPNEPTIPSLQSRPPQYPQYSQQPPQGPRKRRPVGLSNQARSQATNWWQRFTGWFGAQSLPVRIGSGCAGLIVACVICSCCATVFNPGGGTSATANATATTRIAQATQAHPSDATATTGAATATSTVTATGTRTTSPGSATATPNTKPAPTATPKPQPKPTNTPVPRPAPTATPCPGVNCNPWGYNFTPGNYIYSPPSTFCNYLACIGNFWNGHGYVMQCQDNMFSKSGGISGSCSQHGGNKRPLYSH